MLPANGSKTPRGLFVGLTTVDTVLSFEHFPQEDTKNTARQYLAAAGGPASNAAVAFAYLGGAATLVSSVGRSGVADVAKQDLARRAVRHVDLTEVRGDDPAVSVVVVCEDSGSRTILTSPAIDRDADGPCAVGTLSAVVESADIVLLDGYEPEVAKAVAARARAAGTTVVLDGDRYKPGLEDILPMVDIAIFGKSFAIPGSTEESDLFDYFASYGARLVVATNGADPVKYLSGGSRRGLEVEPVRAVDTLAAGDFFHGAFCYAMASGSGDEQALSLAARIASRSVTQFGTRAWMSDDQPIPVQ